MDLTYFYYLNILSMDTPIQVDVPSILNTTLFHLLASTSIKGPFTFKPLFITDYESLPDRGVQSTSDQTIVSPAKGVHV